MSKLLERAQKLIALSASPNANEARNAAFEACKLIRENRLTLHEELSFDFDAYLQHAVRVRKYDYVHISNNDRRSLCNTSLTDGVNFFRVEHRPKGSLPKNLCPTCLKKARW